MRKLWRLTAVPLALVLAAGSTPAEPLPDVPVLLLPRLEAAPVIDGDLDDWRAAAFTDGLWDIHRLRHTPWFEPWRNRLTDHGTAAAPEPPPADDLAARYYTAWDSTYLYLGVEARDNVNDVSDPEPAPQRWYSKDSVCWFVEAPRDDTPETFARGANGFCFVIDAARPDYGAWWRHGTDDASYVEQPLPAAAVDYVVRVDPQDRGVGDFVLEARVDMAATLGASSSAWTPPQVGDEYGLEIVHCDPDGGAYGGHFILYGTGDDDATWSRAVLSDPSKPPDRARD